MMDVVSRHVCLALVVIYGLVGSNCGNGDETSIDFAAEITPYLESSRINFTQDGEFFGQVIPSGTLYFKGGDCPEAACDIELAGVDMSSTDNMTDSDGNVWSNISIQNTTTPSGEINKGALLISPGKLEIKLNAKVNGSGRVDTYSNTIPLGVWLDMNSGTFESYFVLANASGVEATVVLAGHIVDEPPAQDTDVD